MFAHCLLEQGVMYFVCVCVDSLHCLLEQGVMYFVCVYFDSLLSFVLQQGTMYFACVHVELCLCNCRIVALLIIFFK